MAWRELLRDVSTEYEQYLREVGQLNLRHARALQDLTVASGVRLAEAFGGADTCHPPRHHRQVALALDGVVGGSASGTFTVANTRDDAASLSFAADRLVDVASTAGSAGDGFTAAVSFAPASVRLDPGAESTVTVTVPLDPDRFEPGHVYRGGVRVLGGDGTHLEVTVRTALEPVPKPPVTKPPARKVAARKAAARKAAATPPARARRTPRRPG